MYNVILHTLISLGDTMRYNLRILLISLLIVLAFIARPSHVISQFSPVSISVTSSFDLENDNLPIIIDNLTYGSRVSVLNPLEENSDYVFAFWIVDGVVREDLAIDHSFLITSDLTLEAIFSPKDYYAVIFRDSNGARIHTDFVEPESSLNSPSHDINGQLVDNYRKPGYSVKPAATRWNHSLDSFNTHTVVTLQYERIDHTQYPINVLNGSGSGLYLFNNLVTVTANQAPEGEYFCHWSVNNKIVSYDQTYTFTAIHPLDLEAVYKPYKTMNIPLINLFEPLHMTEGRVSYVAQFNVPEAFELIEYGLLASSSAEPLTFESHDFSHYKGRIHTNNSNEFLMTFNENTYTNVRAYLVVRNNQDELLVVYNTQNYDVNFTETFDTWGLPGSYTTSPTSVVGAYGIEWEYIGGRNDAGYPIDGATLVFRSKESTHNPYLESDWIEGGIKGFSIDMRKAFTGGSNNRQIKVIINPEEGDSIERTSFTFGASGTDETIHTFSFDDIEIEGRLKIRVENLGAQIALDNLTWIQDEIFDLDGFLLVAKANIDYTPSVITQGPLYSNGSSITVSAQDTVSDRYEFSHWMNALTEEIVSTSLSYSFNINQHTKLVAVYEVISSDYTVTLTSDHDVELNYSPQSVILHGDIVSIIAPSKEGYRFELWRDLDTMNIVSIQPNYSFSITKNTHYKAEYLPEDQFQIYLSSNISSQFSKSAEGPHFIGDTITLTTTAHAQYDFVYWYDYYNDEIISTDQTTSLTISKSQHIVAVYEYLELERAFYSTGFENTSKQAYAGGYVYLDSQIWYFEDALIGSDGSDQKFQSRAARIRNGYIESQFSVPYMYNLSFYHAHAAFSGDSPHTVIVQVSGNQSSWIEIDRFQTQSTLSLKSYNFDLTFYDEHGLDPELGLYVKIISQTTNRLNIDNLSITQRRIIRPPFPQDLLDNEVLFPNNSELLTVVLEDVIYYYSLGDDFIEASCTVIFQSTGLPTEDDCFVEASVDTSQRGEYQVVYYVIDELGFYASQTIDKVVFRDASLMEYEYSSYYQGIEGLYGEALFLALRTLIQTGYSLQTYDAARDILEEADADLIDPSKVLLIYDRNTVTGTWDGTSWHREHVWPNSRLGVERASGSDRNVATDLHNLRAINPSTNSRRGNLPFEFY